MAEKIRPYNNRKESSYCRGSYPYDSEWWFKVKRSKVKVTENENVKIVVGAYLRKKSIDLHQTKTKMISGPFYTYLHIHFTSENALFCGICLSVCLSVKYLTYLSFTLYLNVRQNFKDFDI